MKRSLASSSSSSTAANNKKARNMSSIEERLLNCLNRDGTLMLTRVDDYVKILKVITKIETKALFLVVLEQTIMQGAPSKDDILEKVARSDAPERMLRWIKVSSGEAGEAELATYTLKQLRHFPISFKVAMDLKEKGILKILTTLAKNKRVNGTISKLAKSVKKTWKKLTEEDKKRIDEREKKLEEEREKKAEAKRRHAEEAERKAREKEEELKALEMRLQKIEEDSAAAPLFSTISEVREEEMQAKRKMKKRVRWADVSAPLDVPSPMKKKSVYGGWGLKKVKLIEPRANRANATPEGGGEAPASSSSISDEQYDKQRQMRKDMVAKVEWQSPKDLSSASKVSNEHIAVTGRSDDANDQLMRLKSILRVHFADNEIPVMPGGLDSVKNVKPEDSVAVQIPMSSKEEESMGEKSLNAIDAAAAAAIAAVSTSSANDISSVKSAPAPELTPEMASKLNQVLSNPQVQAQVQARQTTPSPPNDYSNAQPRNANTAPNRWGRTSSNAGNRYATGHGQRHPYDSNSRDQQRGGWSGYGGPTREGGYHPRGGFAQRGRYNRGRGGHAPRGGRYAPRGAPRSAPRNQHHRDDHQRQHNYRRPRR